MSKFFGARKMGKIERGKGVLAVFSKYDDVVLKVKRQLDTSKSTT